MEVGEVREVGEAVLVREERDLSWVCLLAAMVDWCARIDA